MGSGELTCPLVSAGGGGPALLPLQASPHPWLPAPLPYLSDFPSYGDKVREFGPAGGGGRQGEGLAACSSSKGLAYCGRTWNLGKESLQEPTFRGSQNLLYF